MDIKKLEYFCSVANHMSFSKAAEECQVAQTAISRIIASMEEELGFQLFYRNRHKVELTTAGKGFLEFAERMINNYSMAKQSCAEIANGCQGTITIGYGGFDVSFIKKYIPGFISSFPQYSVILKEYSYDEIVEAMISKDCDVIFAPSSRLGKQIPMRRLITSSFDNMIGVGKKHRFYDRTEVSPEELNGETFICAYETINSWHQLKQFERTCSIYGITPGRRLHTNTAVSLLTMVELGLGIAFLTDNVDLRNADVHMLSIKSATPVMKMHVAACMSPAENPVVDEFMDHLEKALKSKTADGQ